MPKKQMPCQAEADGPKSGLPPVYSQMYALLHTLRSLEAQAEALCPLLTEVQRTRKLGPRARRELEAVLHDMPVEMLRAEVRALWAAVEQATENQSAA